MGKPYGRKQQTYNCQAHMTLVAKPVSDSASDYWRQIVDNTVRKLGRRNRALQISKRNPAKQYDRNPVKWRFHTNAVAKRLRFGKAAVYWSAVAAMLLTASCSEGQPEGQVLASVDGIDVTRRELQQDMAAARLENGASGNNEKVAFEGLIDRKILASEALTRGVDLDSNFHFSLRRARENLLIEALRDEIRKGLPAIDRSTVDRFIESQQWRFEKRFRLTLSRLGGGGEPVFKTFDSRNYSVPLSKNIIVAKAGDAIDLEGQKWKVVAREENPIAPELSARLARDEIESDLTDKHLRQIVTDHRQFGRILYQGGYGPTEQ